MAFQDLIDILIFQLELEQFLILARVMVVGTTRRIKMRRRETRRTKMMEEMVMERMRATTRKEARKVAATIRTRVAARARVVRGITRTRKISPPLPSISPAASWSLDTSSSHTRCGSACWRLSISSHCCYQFR